MKYSFLDVGGVQTHVAAWGGWVEEEHPAEVIICLPGNPGLAGFYYKYLNELHTASGLPVWILGHAGHEEPSYTPAPHVYPIGPVRGREGLFDLPGQLAHKQDFLTKYTSPSTKVHLIGHSVGGWMAMELLKLPEVGDRIASVNLLFPTLQKIAKTRNGMFLNCFVRRISFLISILAVIFANFPLVIRKSILCFYFFITGTPDWVLDVALKYICPSVLEKVLFMAYSEMDLIRELDIDNLKRNASKVKMIYNRNDGWAPDKHFAEYRQLVPSLHIEEVTYNHSFVLSSSEEVASITARFISAN